MSDDYPPIFWTREQRQKREAELFEAWRAEQNRKTEDR